MRQISNLCLCVATSSVFLAMYAWAQQQSSRPGIPTEPKISYEVSPLPKTFRITDEDLKVALAISREVAAGHDEQIKKLIVDNHLSIPQFQRTVAVACSLSAARQLSQAAARPKSQSTGTGSASIQNVREVQAQLNNVIEKLFGGRGSNYREAKSVVDRQQAAVNELCTSIVKKAPGIQ